LTIGVEVFHKLPTQIVDSEQVAGRLWVVGIVESLLVMWESTKGELQELESIELWDGHCAGRLSLAAHGNDLVCLAGQHDDVHWTLIDLSVPEAPRIGSWRPLPWPTDAYQGLSIDGTAHLFTVERAEGPDTVTVLDSVLSPRSLGWRRLASLQTSIPGELRMPGGQPVTLDGACELDLEAELIDGNVRLRLRLTLATGVVQYRVIRKPRGWPRGDWLMGQWSIDSTHELQRTVADEAETPRGEALSPPQLLQEIEQLIYSYEGLRQKAETLRQENVQLESRNQRLTHELDAVRWRFKELHKSNTRIRDALRQAMADRQDLSSRLAVAEERLNELSEKLGPEVGQANKPPEATPTNATVGLLQRFVQWIRE